MKHTKKLICKKCGCPKFSKQEDTFVCLVCGTEYPIPEVKKIMTDGGIVDIQETLIDINSIEINNKFLKCKYCNGILEKDNSLYACNRCGAIFNQKEVEG